MEKLDGFGCANSDGPEEVGMELITYGHGSACGSGRDEYGYGSPFSCGASEDGSGSGDPTFGDLGGKGICARY